MDKLLPWLSVALGGSLGAMLRYGVALGVGAPVVGGLPKSTLTVNILGSFIFGLLMVIGQSWFQHSEQIRLMIMVGLLGAFTTFSTFSYDTYHLFVNGFSVQAVIYVLLSMFSCIIAIFMGVSLGRLLV